MKGEIIFILVLMFVAFNNVQAQTENTKVTQKYEYSFSGKATTQQLEKVESELYRIETITQVKISYKQDSFKGLLFFSRTFYSGPGELTDDFNAARIKQILSEAGLIPEEFKEL